MAMSEKTELKLPEVLDEIWGPFRVKLWEVRGQFKSSVHEGAALVFWGLSANRQTALCALDAVLRAEAALRGLRLRRWRSK